MYEVYVVLNNSVGWSDYTSEVDYGSSIDSLLAKVRRYYSDTEIDQIAFTKINSTAVRQGRATLGCIARKRAEGNTDGSKAVPPVRRD